MKITLLQQDIAWADPAENQRRSEAAILAAPLSDLYVLPEMWSRSVKNGEDPYGGTIYRYEYYYITKIGDSSFTGYNIMKKDQT